MQNNEKWTLGKNRVWNFYYFDETIFVVITKHKVVIFQLL